MITDDALEAAANLSARYVTERFLPDKAIDLIDEAASRVRMYKSPAALQIKDAMDQLQQNSGANTPRRWMRHAFDDAQELMQRQSELEDRLSQLRAGWQPGEESPRVTAEDIAEMVSMWTGVPVMQIAQEESERLLHMEKALHERIIGQDEAIDAIARAVRRARAGLKDPKRPIGSFIFLGPTGVGKTELTKALARLHVRQRRRAGSDRHVGVHGAPLGQPAGGGASRLRRLR